jgi:hypothetical protein
MKWLAVLFSLFILLIIVLADVGVLSRALGFYMPFPLATRQGISSCTAFWPCSSTWLFSARGRIKTVSLALSRQA